MNAAFYMAVAVICGCASTQPPPRNAQDRFRIEVQEHQFHRAFLDFDNVAKELHDIPEGAVGVEYELLLSSTSGIGTAAWGSILVDPKIAVERKLDLVRQIDADNRSGN